MTSRKYDIIERLKAKNERPFLCLDEGHAYEINTSKTNVLHIISLYDDLQNNQNGASQAEMVDKVIELSLGKDAMAFINSQQMTFAATQDIVMAIMASISNVSLEEAEAEEKKAQKNTKK